jgi:hypothetical protein
MHEPDCKVVNEVTRFSESGLRLSLDYIRTMAPKESASTRTSGLQRNAKWKRSRNSDNLLDPLEPEAGIVKKSDEDAPFN